MAYLTRLGVGMIPEGETVYQEGDLVHLVMVEADAPRIESTLAAAPVVEGAH